MRKERGKDMPKLDRNVVVQIRRRYDRGYPGVEIAKGFRVSEKQVSQIGNRRTYKRVKVGNGRIDPYPYPISEGTPDPTKAKRAGEAIMKMQQQKPPHRGRP